MATLKRINKDAVSISDSFKVYIVPASSSKLCISIHDEYPEVDEGGKAKYRDFICKINQVDETPILRQPYTLDKTDNYRAPKVIYHLLIDLNDALSDEESDVDGFMFLLELFVKNGEDMQPICLEEFILDGESELIESNKLLAKQLLNIANNLRVPVKAARAKTSSRPAAT